MSIALDIDGRRLSSLRRQGRRLIGRHSPACYLSVPPHDAEKRLLERARIPYATCDGNTILLGRHAADLAPLLHVPRLPLLPEGRVPENDPLARQMLAAIIESLLPEPVVKNETCALLLPQGETARDREPTREWEFFSRVVRLRGYEPVAVKKCQALALAELGHTAFTGLTLRVEASSSGLALVHNGRVAEEAVLPRGGDWIDEQLARKTERVIWDMNGNSYIDLAAIETWKRQTALDLHNPADDDVQILAYTCQTLLQELINALAVQLTNNVHVETLRQAQTLVCCGDLPRMRGFTPLLGELIHRNRLPVAVADLKIVDDPLYAIARGGLIAAELESPQSPAVAA
ncbi:MAG: hypothetical protein DWQ34_01910 [Planctomycetota bacterium]|nr:MAG: hypothetical protein DWQ29_18250 [Planctomycetota bacterium]REJ97566.1 MAG: hypothetical protein DWQ34_01910 [Planctomycetota bacterium]REK26907.1 MAG: hypothetical protein DWQ41_08700 [Planctomycetota bacterium]REK35396.1 MAG: hypothetical protein DWQ45_11815 [Planctomycetota bacterium]